MSSNWSKGSPPRSIAGSASSDASSRGQRLCLLVEVAAAHVSHAEWIERRLLGVADVLASPQRGAKTQPAGACSVRFGRKPGIVSSLPWVLPRAAARNAAQQADRVRVARVVQHLLDRSFLDEPARIKDPDAVAHLGDHAEVVADEEDHEVCSFA